MRIRKYESHIKQLATQEQEIVGMCASDPYGKCTIYDMTAKFWGSNVLHSAKPPCSFLPRQLLASIYHGV